MTRGCLIVLCLLLAAPLCAQNTSTTQMRLAASTTFTERLQYLMVQQAIVVKAEALSTTCHLKRSAFADEVIQFPHERASKAAVLIASSNVGGAVIVGTVVANANPALVDSSASDTALLTAIVNGWNALAKCDTGS